jgi:purine-binding chemotaxis protein CheW
MPRPKKTKPDSAPRNYKGKSRHKPSPAVVAESDPTPLPASDHPLLLASAPNSQEASLEEVLDELFKQLMLSPNYAQDDVDDDNELFSIPLLKTTPSESFNNQGLEQEMRASFEATLNQSTEPNPVFHGLAALLTPAAERPAPTPESNRQLLLFVLDEKLYGLALENLVEINRPLPITSLPNLPAWLQGITNVRGDIVSVLDIRAFFGEPSQEIIPRQRMLLVRSKITDIETLIVVDQVREFFTLPGEQQIAPLPAATNGADAYTQGTAPHKAETVYLLDVEKLLHDSCAWRHPVKYAA